MGYEFNRTSQFAKLSLKHIQVLELIAQHRTSKEIARQLQISPYTVEQRVQTIRAKFGEVPRRELGRLFMELQIELCEVSGTTRVAYAGQRQATCGIKSQASFEQKWFDVLNSKFLNGFLIGLVMGLVIALISVIATYAVIGKVGG